MIEESTLDIKLVEYNTIASSFGCLKNQVNKLQTYVRDKYEDCPIKYNIPRGGHLESDDVIDSEGYDYIDELTKRFV
jgi:hypothetical protein